MKYTTLLLRVIVLFGITILSVYALQEANMEGKWNGKMAIPNFGTYEMTMIRATKGRLTTQLDILPKTQKFKTSKSKETSCLAGST